MSSLRMTNVILLYTQTSYLSSMRQEVKTLINSKLDALKMGELNLDQIGAFLCCILEHKKISQREYDAQFKKALRILLFP